MKLFSIFNRKPAPVIRRVLDGETVKKLLAAELEFFTAANYRHITQKDRLQVCDMNDVVSACKEAKMPWRKDVWECEDIARAALNQIQRRAANAGCSFACGTLRGRQDADTLHVYLWCVVESPGSRLQFPDSRVMFYDPTALRWVATTELKDVDYSMT